MQNGPSPSPPAASEAPSPPARASGSGSVLLLTVVGLAGLAGLVAIGAARLEQTAVVALCLAGLGAWLALRRPLGGPSPVGVLAPVPSPAAEAARSPFEDALESLPDPLLIVSAEEPDDLVGKRLTFANAAARTLLRIPRDGALLLSAIRRPEVLEAVDESLFGGLNGSVSFETGGAQDRFWRVWTAPLPSRETRRFCLLVMRDETDVRRNERMRADFLANASHELRTPLASLSGFIETLRGHARDDERARDRFLGIMSAQAERMARLVDDLMSLSRIELNEHIRPDGRCDLGAAASDVADALALIAGERGARVQLDVPARGTATVIGDRDQIVQVIQNLVDNALKYSPGGGTVKVAVTTGQSLAAATAADPASPRLVGQDAGRLSLLTPDRADDCLYAVIRVTDEGPGMQRQHLPRLAERFYRVEGQKSGDRAGTGLGLAIVKHIINRHCGGLWVESAPHRGAMFVAYLPQPAVPVVPVVAAPSSPPLAAPPAEPRRATAAGSTETGPAQPVLAPQARA